MPEIDQEELARIKTHLEQRKAVIAAFQPRGGSLYPYEADQILDAVRPLIEAEVRHRMADLVATLISEHYDGTEQTDARHALEDAETTIRPVGGRS